LRDSERTFRPGPRVEVLQTDTIRRVSEEAQARHVHDLQVLQTLSTARPDEVAAVFWPENSILLPYGTRGGGWLGPDVPDLQRVTARLGIPILVDGWMHDDGTGDDVH